MPSRLGDDPLARAGRGAAKTAGGADGVASPVALDSFGGPAAPQPEIQSDVNAATVALQKSYNDVFFLRRGEEETPQVTSQTEQVVNEPMETSEISEVSEIPEIREIAAAPIVGSERDAEKVAELSQPQEKVEDGDAQGAAADPSAETVEAVEGGETVAEPARLEVPPAPGQEPIALPSSSPDPSQSDLVGPDERGGFFKKVFGRIEK